MPAAPHRAARHPGCCLVPRWTIGDDDQIGASQPSRAGSRPAALAFGRRYHTWHQGLARAPGRGARPTGQRRERRRRTGDGILARVTARPELRRPAGRKQYGRSGERPSIHRRRVGGWGIWLAPKQLLYRWRPGVSRMSAILSGRRLIACEGVHTGSNFFVRLGACLFRPIDHRQSHTMIPTTVVNPTTMHRVAAVSHSIVSLGPSCGTSPVRVVWPINGI